MYLKVVVNCLMMSHDPIHEGAQRHIIDACVQFAKSQGYSDACGVLRGTLFLADEPISLDQLAETTGYSKSTVCLKMNLLENLGVAKRVVIPGDKRSLYVTVKEPNSMKAVLLANIKKEVQLILKALDLTERDLEASGANTEKILVRIDAIRHFYEQIDELLDLIDKFTTEELIELLGKASH
jgi:DNA-binding transcriptional regulator GbsR (MarR family)